MASKCRRLCVALFIVGFLDLAMLREKLVFDARWTWWLFLTIGSSEWCDRWNLCACDL